MTYWRTRFRFYGMNRVWLISFALAAAFAWLPLSAPSAFAQAGGDGASREDLKRYEREMEAAQKRLVALEAAAKDARADLGEVDRELLAAAQDTRRREEQATVLERRLIDLDVRMQTAQADLARDEAGLADLMAALAISARRRPPALATSPNEAGKAIRSAILMRDTVEALETRAQAIRDQVQEIEDLKVSIRRERERLDQTERLLAARKDEIMRLAAIKRAAFEDVSGDADALKIRIAALSRRAETVRGLLASLEAEAPLAPRLKPRTQEPVRMASLPPSAQPDEGSLGAAVLSRLGKPVAGETLRRFGDKLVTGRKSEGITLAARAAAQVTSPADARIEYAGPFRSYGQMLILSTPDGYHIVLSGLDAIYGVRGQSVLAGEPVGRMTQQTDSRPELYMELRKDGTPLDPSKLMAAGAG